jgi:hypothetical protein
MRLDEIISGLPGHHILFSFQLEDKLTGEMMIDDSKNFSTDGGEIMVKASIIYHRRPYLCFGYDTMMCDKRRIN